MSTVPSFIKWLGASAVVVTAIVLLDQYDTRLAYTLALLTLFAVLFRYPGAIDKLTAVFQGK